MSHSLKEFVQKLLASITVFFNLFEAAEPLMSSKNFAEPQLFYVNK
jgi:hypothetical protein